MSKISSEKIKMIVILGVLWMSIGNYSLAEENKKYKENGMEFTVGKHEPEKRIIPKLPEVTVITQTVIVDKSEETVLVEEGNEELQNVGDITSNIEQEEKGSFASMMKEVLASIKKLWEKITTFEKKTDDRISIIEDKLEITSEGSNNVEELTDLTAKILEEIEDQNDRIDELESDDKKTVEGEIKNQEEKK
jgi:hypothetical protein